MRFIKEFFFPPHGVSITYIQFRDDLMFVVFFLAVTQVALNLFAWNYDSTDDWPNRSGMSLHTDALTDCQYLATPDGGITPRLDSAGLHLCTKEPS